MLNSLSHFLCKEIIFKSNPSYQYLKVEFSTRLGLQCIIGGYSFLLMGYLFILVESSAIKLIVILKKL